MSKYIDADALKMDLYSIIKADYGYTADVLAGMMIAERVIDNAPTSDVVEVVRCKDCRHMTCEIGLRYCNAWGGINGGGDDGFCNYGERRKEKG